MPKFGLGLRPQHYSEIITQQGYRQVDFFEIISENFMRVGGQARRHLEWLRAHRPICCHGVGLSIAGRSDLDENYLKDLSDLVHWLEPDLVSDHLCWAEHGGLRSYDLLPFKFCDETLQIISERIDRIQTRLKRTLVLENPSSYLHFAESTMSESQFLALLTKKTGCKVLLDLNNLFVNQINLGSDPISYMDCLGRDMVAQFHLAGPSEGKERDQTFLIDTHDHPVRPEVWHLYKIATSRWPDIPTLLEWDVNIPNFANLCEELNVARLYHSQGCDPNSLPNFDHAPKKSDRVMRHGFADERALLWDHLTDPEAERAIEELQSLCRSDGLMPVTTGLKTYNQGYFLRLSDAMRTTFASVADVMGEELFSRVVKDYLHKHPCSDYSLDRIGSSFTDFLSEELRNFHSVTQRDQEITCALAAFEYARNMLFIALDHERVSRTDLLKLSEEDWQRFYVCLSEDARLLKCCADVPRYIYSAKTSEDYRALTESDAKKVLLFRNNSQVQYAYLSEDEAILWERWRLGETFADSTKDFDEGRMVHAATTLAQWLDWGVVRAFGL